MQVYFEESFRKDQRLQNILSYQNRRLNGLATGVSVGTCTIRVMTGDVSGTATLTVTTGPTNHSGAITADKTWYPSENPHIIVSDVWV